MVGSLMEGSSVIEGRRIVFICSCLLATSIGLERTGASSEQQNSSLPIE